MRGKFIVIEGIDGSGKTTSIVQIIETLKIYNIKKFAFVREPGGTPVAEYLRKLVKHGVQNEQILPISELLIFYAARIQLVENVIKPALSRGDWVIGDRHSLSSFAYQGGGRKISQKILNFLQNISLGKFSPNLTLYLDLPPNVGLERIYNKKKIDHIEKRSIYFFNRVRKSYQTQALTNKKIITINANQSIEKVKKEIHIRLEQWIKLQNKFN